MVTLTCSSHTAALLTSERGSFDSTPHVRLRLYRRGHRSAERLDALRATRRSVTPTSEKSTRERQERKSAGHRGWEGVRVCVCGGWATAGGRGVSIATGG